MTDVSHKKYLYEHIQYQAEFSLLRSLADFRAENYCLDMAHCILHKWRPASAEAFNTISAECNGFNIIGVGVIVRLFAGFLVVVGTPHPRYPGRTPTTLLGKVVVGVRQT